MSPLRCGLVLLVLLAGLSVAPSSGHTTPKYYQNAKLDLPRIDARRAGRYRDVVVRRSRLGQIRSVSWSRDGKRRDARRVLATGGRESQLRKVPLAGIAALAHTASPRFWGGEFDLLVEIRNKGTYPVNLWFDGDGDVIVAVGKKLSGKAPGGFGKLTDASAIRKAHGSGVIKGSGRRWKNWELRILDGALGRLHKDERRVLKGVTIVRSGSSPNPWQAGKYQTDSRGRYTLRVYNRAFASQKTGFVGGADRPRPAGAITILHELGHAVAQWPTRRAFERGDFRKAKRLSKSNSLLKAYRRARGVSRGPTPYGRRSINESFAESFALYHLDPAALKRWNGDVYRWFADGGHREHLRP